MKCFQFDLNRLLKISMLNWDKYVSPTCHGNRKTSEYIIYIVVNGEMKLMADNKPVLLQPGDIYLFEKGCVQKSLGPVDCEFFYIHFDADTVCEFDLTEAQYALMVQKNRGDFLQTDIYGTKSYDFINAVLKQKTHVDKNFLEYIINILKNNIITYGDNNPMWRMSISNAVSKLFMKIEAFSVEENLEHTGRKGHVYSTVKSISDYIEDNYLKPFESEDIEKDLLINFDYANRIFKKYIGYSIIRYRNILRINTAKNMMLVTDKTLGDIAEETGFHDRYYFSRYFKKIEGITPSEYKNRVLTDNEERKNTYE